VKPPRSILDPQFKYRNAAKTDVRETFERIRRELAEQRVVTPIQLIRRKDRNG
jgi:ribosomal protein S25